MNLGTQDKTVPSFLLEIGDIVNKRFFVFLFMARLYNWKSVDTYTPKIVSLIFQLLVDIKFVTWKDINAHIGLAKDFVQLLNRTFT